MANSNFSGADVAQLRALAKTFQEASDRLDRHRMTVANQIKISAWVGPFATSFRLAWESEHSAQVASAAALLHQKALQLGKNADEQDAASRVESGARRAYSSDGTRAGRDSVEGPDAPTSTAGYVRTLTEMTDQDDGIRVQKVMGADGIVRFLVYIAGSGSAHEGRLMQGNDVNGMIDGRLAWGNNPGAAFSLDSKTLSAIRTDITHQIELMGGERKSEVMMVGFSQGGMIAQTLADDSSFNTKEVLTYGSPTIMDFRNYGGANVMHLRHNGDPVQYVDGLTQNPVTEGVAAALDFVSGAEKPEKGDEWNFRAGSFAQPEAHNPDDYGWVAGQFDKSTDSRDVKVQERYARFQGSVVEDAR